MAAATEFLIIQKIWSESSNYSIQESHNIEFNEISRYFGIVKEFKTEFVSNYDENYIYRTLILAVNDNHQVLGAAYLSGTMMHTCLQRAIVSVYSKEVCINVQLKNIAQCRERLENKSIPVAIAAARDLDWDAPSNAEFYYFLQFHWEVKKTNFGTITHICLQEWNETEAPHGSLRGESFEERLHSLHVQIVRERGNGTMALIAGNELFLSQTLISYRFMECLQYTAAVFTAVLVTVACVIGWLSKRELMLRRG